MTLLPHLLWVFNEVAGRYDGSLTLYINVGLGFTAPIRLGVNPEVTLITLKSSGIAVQAAEDEVYSEIGNQDAQEG